VVDEVDERMVSNENRRQLSSFTFNNGVEMKENQLFILLAFRLVWTSATAQRPGQQARQVLAQEFAQCYSVFYSDFDRAV
jgi:hypothetical protein